MSGCVPLANTGGTGTLTINSLLLNGPAWDIPHLESLWLNTAVRGANRRVSGNPGTRALRRRYDETEHQLAMTVIGHFTPAGVQNTDAVAGMVVNLETLRAALVDPIVTGSATVTATLTVPGAASRTAAVQPDLVVSDIRASNVVGGNAKFSICTVVLRLTIPLGRFV